MRGVAHSRIKNNNKGDRFYFNSEAACDGAARFSFSFFYILSTTD
jgi:hypothetical protein